jgi:hypothetical protein
VCLDSTSKIAGASVLSRGLADGVRIFVVQVSATVGLHIPAKTHKFRGINYTWSFWCELATLKPHLIFSYH